MLNEGRESYRLVAGLYDALGTLYTGHQIRHCQSLIADSLNEQECVLFAGCGGGQEARLALQAGAWVNVVDRSRPMLDRARRVLSPYSDKVNVHCEDIRDHRPQALYDAVVASFFLNVFDRVEVAEIFGVLSGLVREEGRLFIADFTPLAGNAATRTLQLVYYGLPLTAFVALTANAWHLPYDYAFMGQEHGFRVAHRPVRIFKVGPKWLSLWTMKKSGHPRPSTPEMDREGRG